jgi:hypothetical protein
MEEEYNYYPLETKVPQDPKEPQYNNPTEALNPSNIVPSPNGTIMQGGTMQSPNYSKGNSGWKIDSSGNIEANDGTFRGTFIIGGSLITVSNINNLQSAIDTLSLIGGGTVALVPQIYNATSSFTIPSGVTIDGNGATINFGGGAYQFLAQGTSAYSTGTLSVNFNSGSVTGSGTTWTSAMVGQSILIGDYWYEITGRSSNTAITISPNFQAPNVSGVTYVIATTVDGVSLQNITLTNSSTSAFKFRYVNGLVMDGLSTTSSGQGIDGDDSANVQWVNMLIDDCVSGATFDTVPFIVIDNGLISNITGGTGLSLNGVSNSSIGILSLQDIVGVGIKFTNCYNLGFINYSIIETTSHGIEFVSGNNDMDLLSGYLNTMGGDGIKLTATSDRIRLESQSLSNYTGYGINISNSNCDNNVILSPSYGGGGSGTLNDSGTNTIVISNVVPTISQISTPSRSLGTNYQNTTGHNLFVMVSVSVTRSGTGSAGNYGRATAYMDTTSTPTTVVGYVESKQASAAAQNEDYQTQIMMLTFVVPNNSYYRVSSTGTGGSASLETWKEQTL